ncbi:MAG: ABC transporter ATP-binding protein [Geminicoccaceae bacterium]
MQATAQRRAATDAAVVSAQGLCKSFAEGSVVALDHASFDIRAGSFVSLVGPSGCGKSTILRLISGLIGKTEGQLKVHGDLVIGPRADVGMMFQKATLLEWRTVIENVLLPTELAGGISKADREQAAKLLRMVGLDDFLFSYPTQLSGGMQQRVALARLLQTGADILLLDEPFGALDEFTRERLNVELMRIVGEVGATTLFVTHNIAEAIFLADQVIVMTPRPGRIAAIVDVPLERPRPLSIQTSHEFNQLAARVRDILGADH